MKPIITPSQLSVCADRELEQSYWQDFEHYRISARRRRVLRAKRLGVDNERELSATLATLVGLLERGQRSLDEVVHVVGGLLSRSDNVATHCRLGWLVDYLRVTYEYL